MSDFDVRNIPSQPEPDEEPIPFDNEDVSEQSGVSHSPLSLGGKPVEVAKSQPASQPSTQPIKPAEQKEQKPSGDRVTGVRTFFTKLHAGAIEFLDSQITEWLQKNPGIVIKRTNTVTGEVQGKKSEPNIIINIWY
ncbi:hypothetical protein ACFL1G_04685 [Planctomycetota bacterium]